jgi:hypothetical protein
MDRSDRNDLVFDELCEAKALRSREGKAGRDSSLEDVEMRGQAHGRDEEVKIVESFRVCIRQDLSQKVGLLLVVSFKSDAVIG